jgi:Thioredoxin
MHQMTVNGHDATVLTYREYMAGWREKNALSMKGLDKVGRRMRHYSRYNYDRQQGVELAFRMTEDFREAVKALQGPQTWYFLTDDWCIDSAYSLPLLLEAAALHGDIALHILMRDDNLEIMDDYLTDDKRSIPILVGFDKDDKQLFRWGPNPDELEKLRTSLQAAGEPGRVVSGSTIDWYAADGYLVVEKELAALFSGVK